MKILKRTNDILLFIIIVLILFYYGATFLIPFGFGVFLAMLMTPLCNFLEKFKINSILASLLSTIVVFTVIGAISYLFIYQISLFSRDLPELRQEANTVLQNLQEQVSSSTGVSMEEQDTIIQNRSGALIDIIESHLTNLFGGILDIGFKFVLLIIYVFLFLIYRKKFRRFFTMLYKNKDRRENVELVLKKVSKVVYHYLWGRVQVMSILAILYYITFLIFGLNYAILLTIFGALITIIPYLGPLLSGVVPVLFSIIYFEDTYTIVVFAAIVLVIQLIESYVLEPLIIGKEVKINPLAVIIAIILGGIIWGIAGMILFVPIFATIKIISNHHETLKPIGYLLGNERK